MRTSKSIADDFLKRKARADAEALKEGEAEKAEAEKAEAEKADELIKGVIAEKLKEAEAEKEAEKSSGFSGPFTTKPMKEPGKKAKALEPMKEYSVRPVFHPKSKEGRAQDRKAKESGLQVHTVEPVIPIEEKPIEEKPVREKSVDRPAVVKKVRVQAKPVVENPGKPVVKKRWYDRIRPFGFEDSE